MTHTFDHLKTHGFWYLASPYTHPEWRVQDDRAHEANVMAGMLLSKGIFVHQPIWSTHRIADLFTLPGDHLFWLNFNKAFIDPSVGMIMCDIPGWKESKGCQQEINYCKEIGKPVYLFDGNATITEI